MLPSSFIIITFILRLLGSAVYIRAIIKGQVRPNLLSWFLWSLTPLIAFAAVARAGEGASGLGMLALALSAVVVLIVVPPASHPGS